MPLIGQSNGYCRDRHRYCTRQLECPGRPRCRRQGRAGIRARCRHVARHAPGLSDGLAGVRRLRRGARRNPAPGRAGDRRRLSREPEGRRGGPGHAAHGNRRDRRCARSRRPGQPVRGSGRENRHAGIRPPGRRRGPGRPPGVRPHRRSRRPRSRARSMVRSRPTPAPLATWRLSPSWPTRACAAPKPPRSDGRT